MHDDSGADPSGTVGSPGHPGSPSPCGGARPTAPPPMGSTQPLAPHASPTPGPAASKPRRRFGVLTPILLAVGLLGTLLVGAWLGHTVWPRTDVQIVMSPGASATTTSATGAMPDVLGMAEVYARRAVTDAGVTATVTVAKRQAAGPAGHVVDQAPAPGERAEAVTLTISTPATLASYAGRPAADVRTALEQLGAVVTVRRVVHPTAAAGTVVASRPAAGQPLPAAVELDVADPGDPLSLTDVSSIGEDACRTNSDIHVAEQVFETAVTCTRENADDAPYVEYDVSRRAQALRMTVGVDNRGRQGSGVVAVYGDGRLLSRAAVSFGKATPVTVPVTGVIRLRIQVTTPEEGPTVVLGDPALLGEADQLEALRR